MHRSAIFTLCCFAVVGCVSKNNETSGQSSLVGRGQDDGSFGERMAAAGEASSSGNQDSSLSNRNMKIKGSDGPGQEFSVRESQDSKNNENIQPQHQVVHHRQQPKDENNLKLNSEKGTEEATITPSGDVCFPYVGCFNMSSPWRSPLRPIGRPQNPRYIETSVLFYSRSNLKVPVEVKMYHGMHVGKVTFDPKKKTAIIIHGFASSGRASWVNELKNTYLERVDANVLVVDWNKGANHLNYFQVVANTRVVAREMRLLIEHLKGNFQANVKNFHLIGHSLGAQIAAYIGKGIPGIDHLTALDPAQPAFEGFDKVVRLDKGDAEFVEVIHTDAKPFVPTLGFGMISPIGHVDFYMNGGFDQPGCLTVAKKEIPVIRSLEDLAKVPVEVISKIVSCPHSRSYEYYTEAISNKTGCVFWGRKANIKTVLMASTNTLSQGLLKKVLPILPKCNETDCVPLGLESRKSPLTGVFVITTNNNAPFCIGDEHPRVQPSSGPESPVKPQFHPKLKKI